MKKVLLFFMVCVGLCAKVSVSIAPQEFLVEKIAGDTISVNTLVGTNDDPHSYEPKPKQLKDIEKSDIYFRVGIEFEDIWVERLANKYKNIKFINTQEGIVFMKNSHHHDGHHSHNHHSHNHHSHNHHDEHHHHGEFDTHIWLDPVNMQIMAKNIANALSKEYPEHKALYETNLNKLLLELDELDKYNQNKLSSLKGKPFMVYHPSWGYYAKRYGLKQIAVEIDGKEPKAKDLEELVEEALEHKIKIIFVSPQFSSKSAEVIAKKTNAKVYKIDQLSKDYIKQMKKMTDAIYDSLR